MHAAPRGRESPDERAEGARASGLVGLFGGSASRLVPRRHRRGAGGRCNARQRLKGGRLVTDSRASVANLEGSVVILVRETATLCPTSRPSRGSRARRDGGLFCRRCGTPG